MSLTKSIVLSCAGIGSRLGLAQTKALIKIMGKTMLQWNLELFKDIEDVRMVIGYQATEVIQEALKHRRDLIFVYNHEYFATKTGASYYLGARYANDLVIEWDGDLLVHPDDAKQILSLDEEYVAYSEKSSVEAVFLSLDHKGNVISFSREEGDFEWTGPCCLKKERINFDATHVYSIIEPHLPMKGVKIRAQDIDVYDDYKRAEKFIQSW